MCTVGLMLLPMPRKSLLCSVFHGLANASKCRVTRDLLLLNDSFATEQRKLWFHNRTGQLSSLFQLIHLELKLHLRRALMRTSISWSSCSVGPVRSIPTYKRHPRCQDKPPILLKVILKRERTATKGHRKTIQTSVGPLGTRSSCPSRD